MVDPGSFEERYIPEPNSGCWLWLGDLDSGGYGRLKIKGKTYRAHRFSLLREQQTDLFVCHKCDTPSCVNPDHLFLGTHSDNMKDMVSKNRHSGGLYSKQGQFKRLFKDLENLEKEEKLKEKIKKEKEKIKKGKRSFKLKAPLSSSKEKLEKRRNYHRYFL